MPLLPPPTIALRLLLLFLILIHQLLQVLYLHPGFRSLILRMPLRPYLILHRFQHLLVQHVILTVYFNGRVRFGSRWPVGLRVLGLFWLVLVRWLWVGKGRPRSLRLDLPFCLEYLRLHIVLSELKQLLVP